MTMENPEEVIMEDPAENEDNVCIECQQMKERLFIKEKIEEELRNEYFLNNFDDEENSFEEEDYSVDFDTE